MKAWAVLAAAAMAASISSASFAQSQAQAQRATPDAARLALAHQVIDAIGGARGTEAQIRSLYASIEGAMSKDESPEVARITQMTMQDSMEEMVKLLPSIIDISARAYAQNLTEQQLRDLLAFYRSDSGQAYIQKLPNIMQQSMAEEMPLIRAMTPAIAKKALDRVCAEAKCTPETRQTIAASLAKATGQPAS